MTEPQTNHTLAIIVAPEPGTDQEDSKSLFGGRPSARGVVKQIPVEELRKQIDGLSEDVGRIFTGTTEPDSGLLHLKELSVQVEITASGGINLIGTANVGAAASMTLTFSR